MTPSNLAFHDSPCRKELGNPDTGHSYPSVEELKNIWIPHAIKMRLTKSKELDVCNWSESDEVKADEILLGLRGFAHVGLWEQNWFRTVLELLSAEHVRARDNEAVSETPWVTMETSGLVVRQHVQALGFGLEASELPG